MTTQRRIAAIVWALLLAAAQQGAAASHARHAQEDGGSQGESKWVVMTTTSQATETAKALAAVPGWKLVVVADKNTPKDWALDGALAGVDFLDLDRQQALGYSILPLLPDNHLACAPATP